MTELAQAPAVAVDSLRVPRFQAAYTRLLPQLETFAQEKTMSVNLDIPSIVTAVLGAISEIRKLKEPARRLPDTDVTHFDNLEPLVLAMGYAHSLHKAASLPTLPVQDLSQQVVEKREVFASDCAALARRGLVDGERLAELKGPIGYKNQAFDLLTLVALMRESWPRIQGKTAVSALELDEAETLADQLLTVVGEREQLPASRAETGIIRERAYTLFMQSYNEVRRAVSYLRWNHGDLDQLVPNVYAGRRRRVSAASPQEEEPEEEERTNAAGVSDVAPRPDVEADDIAPGLPGNSPFIKAR